MNGVMPLRYFSFDRLIKDKNMGVRLIRSGRSKCRYVIDWRDEYGIRHSFTHGYSKRSADNFWHKQITLRAERRTLDRKPISGLTFYVLCDEYLEKYAKIRKWSWKSDASKVRRFKAFFKNIAIEAISQPHINDYTNFRKSEGIQGATINREVTIIKRIFWYGKDNGMLDQNPAREWMKFPENQPDESYLEWGQYKALLGAVERLLAASGKVWRRRLHLEQFRYMIPLSYEAGGRRRENLFFKKGEFGFSHPQGRVLSRKGEKKVIKKRWGTVSGHLFVIRGRLPLQQDIPFLCQEENENYWRYKLAFNRQWKSILKEAGIPSVVFYRLRHSFCSLLANKGVDVTTRMRLMGHSGPQMQQRYSHISEERKRQVMKVFDDLNVESSGGRLEKTNENGSFQYNSGDQNVNENQSVLSTDEIGRVLY